MGFALLHCSAAHINLGLNSVFPWLPPPAVPDDLSLGGTYTGKEAMGLLWSMRPVSGSRDAIRQAAVTRRYREHKYNHQRAQYKKFRSFELKPLCPFPARYRISNVCSPLLVNFSVYSGHQAEGFRERTPLASTLVERWYMALGVQRIAVREKGVRGTLFMPPGAPASPFFLHFKNDLIVSHLWSR